MSEEEYIEVAKTSQIDDGQLMHIEISDKEILIANINGKFYAMDDRCSHMNARLSLGNISKNIVTFPFHAAKFEVTSGKKIGEPVLSIPPEMEPLPPNWKKYMDYVGQQMSFIKTKDQKIYDIKVDGDNIKIRI